jgi:hypothetical protein
MMSATPRRTLRWHLKRKLGPGGGRQAWFNFFVRPFAAPSFAAFWRSWNPVYGYFLHRYSYKPLSSVIGRRGAVLATFILCGFALHDVPAWVVTRRILPPGATIAFTFFGLGAILSEASGMDLSRSPGPVRAATNVAYITGCIGAMLFVLRRTGTRRDSQSQPSQH